MQHTRETRWAASGGRTAVALAAKLRADIASGVFVQGQFMPAVRQLARQYGFATVTVNRALKMLAAEGMVISQPRHGYRVCPGAGDPERGLPVAYLNSTRHVVGRSSDQFHKTLLMQFQQVASRRGWPLISADADGAVPKEIVRQVTAANCCGVITNSAEPGLWGELRGVGMPSLLVDAWREGFEADCVLQDGFMGGLQAVGHLLERGHPRIAWIGPEMVAGNAQVLERFGGAHAGLVRAGTDFSHLVEAPLGDPGGAAKAARTLLAGPDRPGAILALWQDLGAAVARAAAELGLLVGRDFQMVGWCTEEEYADFGSWFPPGRVPAAVTWSIARMAEAAVARLKQRRAEPQLAPATIRIPTAVIAGGTQ